MTGRSFARLFPSTGNGPLPPDRHRADVRCRAVLLAARYQREMAGRSYGPASGGVRALCRQHDPGLAAAEPLEPSRYPAHQEALAAGGAFAVAARFNGPELLRAEISAARRDRVDHVRDAASGGAGFRAAARRMARATPARRDRCRVHRRARDHTARPWRHASGGAALHDRRRLLRLLFDLDPASGGLRPAGDDNGLFRRRGNGRAAAAYSPVLDLAGWTVALGVDAGDRRHGRLRALAADPGAPAGARDGAGAVHLFADRLDGHVGLSRLRAATRPLDLHRRSHRDLVGLYLLYRERVRAVPEGSARLD